MGLNETTIHICLTVAIKSEILPTEQFELPCIDLPIQQNKSCGIAAYFVACDLDFLQSSDEKCTGNQMFIPTLTCSRDMSKVNIMLLMSNISIILKLFI